MTLTILAVLGIGCGALGLIVALDAHRRARGAASESLDILGRHASREGVVDPLALRDVSVYRYDALEEMTGQLSFSIAFLNSVGDGLVLTSINGRTETRTYVRPVRSGKGIQPLSPEEEEAVRSARLGLGPEVRPSRVRPSQAKTP